MKSFWHGWRLPKLGRWQLELLHFTSGVPELPVWGWWMAVVTMGCWWIWHPTAWWAGVIGIVAGNTLANPEGATMSLGPPGNSGAGIGQPIASNTVDASQFAGTREQRIQQAIDRAGALIATGVWTVAYVWIPASMLPYTASLVTFNPAVQMIREGGNINVWDVHAYGAVGDGVTDDKVAINAADANAPPRATVRFGAGKTYAISSLAGGTSLKGGGAQVWDLNGSTIKYTGAGNVTTGSDGAAIPLLAVLGAPFAIRNGILDGNNKVAFPLGIQGALTGPFELAFLTIQNTLEANSTWNGIAYTVSVDVSGIAITGARAQNVSGLLTRPNCPVINASNTIVAHQQVGAVLIGSSAVWGNATGTAFVSAGGTESTVFNMTCGHALGVPQAMSNSGDLVAGNVSLMDFIAYDGGFRRIEMYGPILSQPIRQTFSSGGAYTPTFFVAASVGAAEASTHILTVSANVAVTIADPTAPGISVDRVGSLQFIIRNTSGGALTTPVTFTGASYRVSATVSPGNNQQITVNLMWDQVAGTYIEIGRSAAVAT
jgi:hypothetical protein